MTRTNRFTNIFLAKVDARRYAAMRVAFGALALFQVAHLWPYRVSYYTSAGMTGEGAAIALNPGLYLSLFAVFKDPVSVTILFVAAALAAVLLINGTMARVAAVAVWIFLLSTAQRSPNSTTGWDAVLTNFFFLLAFSPLGEKWTLRDLWERGRTAEPQQESPRYGLILMQLQVFVIYWQTVLYKLPDEHWHSGEFLAYFFLSHHGRFGGTWPVEWSGSLVLLSYSAILIELAVPILLWFRPTRVAGIILGAALHFGIAFFSINIAPFSFTMMASYLAFVEFGRPPSKPKERRED